MKNMDTILLATTNQGKLTELRQLVEGLDINIKSLADFPSVPDFEETGTTFQENARQKALFYAGQFDLITLADDSGLEVDALNGAPGVFSARFAGVEGASRDQANNQKLLHMMQDIPDDKRTARFRCCLSLVKAPDTVLLEVTGKVEGSITRTPQGNNGFGYDPLFFIPTQQKTAAQLDKAVKNQISHRGMAFKELIKALKANI